MMLNWKEAYLNGGLSLKRMTRQTALSLLSTRSRKVQKLGEIPSFYRCNQKHSITYDADKVKNRVSGCERTEQV